MFFLLFGTNFVDELAGKGILRGMERGYIWQAEIIPYLNGQDLPVWFDKCSISVGDSITESVQKGIEESDMVIFWVTDNFLSSNWCRFEMTAYIKRLIEEEIQMIIVLADEIETKRLPLFLRDIKHIRIDNRTVIEIGEELAKIVKQNQ